MVLCIARRPWPICARHLHSRGLKVRVVLDGDESTLSEAAHNQLQILEAAGMQPINLSQVSEFLRRSELVVDALIGYGLRGASRGETANLIDLRDRRGRRVLSFDVPSGLSATTAEALSSVVRPDRTATLALPKTGLQGVPGDLYLADIDIPLEVSTMGLGSLSNHPPRRASPYASSLQRRVAVLHPLHQAARVPRGGTK